MVTSRKGDEVRLIGGFRPDINDPYSKEILTFKLNDTKWTKSDVSLRFGRRVIRAVPVSQKLAKCSM